MIIAAAGLAGKLPFQRNALLLLSHASRRCDPRVANALQLAGGPSHVKVIPPRRSLSAGTKHGASRGQRPTSEGVQRDRLFRPLPRCRGCAAALVGVIEPHLTPHCGGVADIRRILKPGQCLKPATTVLPACA